MKKIIFKGLFMVAVALFSGITSATSCTSPPVAVGNLAGDLTAQNLQRLRNMEAQIKNNGSTIDGAFVSGPSFSSTRSTALSMRANGLARTIPVTVSGPNLPTAVSASTGNVNRVSFRYQTPGNSLCHNLQRVAGAIQTGGLSNGGKVVLGVLAIGAIAAAINSGGGGGGGGGTTGSTLQ